MNDEHAHDHELVQQAEEPKESVSHQSKKVPDNKKNKKRQWLIAIGGVVVFLLLLTGYVYSSSPVSSGVRMITSVLPYPALVVDGTYITVKDYLVEYDGLLTSSDQEGVTDADPAELHETIRSSFIHRIVVKNFADEKSIVADEEQVDALYGDVKSSKESEEAFAKQIEETFGWTPEKFRDRIVKSIVLASQVTTYILEDDEIQADKKAMADAAHERLDQGELFAQVAKDVHDSLDIEYLESDLGYRSRDEMPEVWSVEDDVLEGDGYSRVIELPESYTIFRVSDRVEGPEGTQYHLFAVIIPKVTFDEFVSELQESVKVRHFLRV